MGKTSIEWTDFSTNPIRARDKRTGAVGHYCEKVSPGCAHCYSSKFQPRFHMPTFGGRRKLPTLPVAGEGGAVSVNDEVEVFLDERRLHEVLKRRKPTTYFWCDMTDLFGEWVPFEWVDRCFAVMALTPQHTHQVLTKRTERMAKYFHHIEESKRGWWHGEIGHLVSVYSGGEDKPMPPEIDKAWKATREHYYPETVGSDKLGDTSCVCPWPLPNVWLGTSCENQQTADERIPHLLKCPAAVRFLSCEPLLGAVDLTSIRIPRRYGSFLFNALTGEGRTHLGEPFTSDLDGNRIGWNITGGESGPGARPMHPDWPRSLRDQCTAAGVAYFFKQWGEHAPPDHRVPGSDRLVHVWRDGRHCPYEQLGEGKYTRADGDGHLTMARVGKKAAGRVLDGRTWDELPERKVVQDA